MTMCAGLGALFAQSPFHPLTLSLSHPFMISACMVSSMPRYSRIWRS